MQTVAQQLGKNELNKFKPHEEVITTDAVGIELELEGFTQESREKAARHLGSYFLVEHDGSLRNGGVEFITNGGLGGETLVKAIEKLQDVLSEIDYSVSFRCSTHMHINMLDFTIPQVVKYILLYTAAEPYLFEIAGKYRYSSNFCTPIAESLPFHRKILSNMVNNACSTGAPLRHCNKYTALNISPLFYDSRTNRALGTLEYRGGRAMTTKAELLLQINILLSLKKFVREFDGNEEAMLNAIMGGLSGTVTPPSLIAHLPVSEDQKERAIMNAWDLLKAYQTAQQEQQHEEELREVRSGTFRSAFIPNPIPIVEIFNVIDHQTQARVLDAFPGLTSINWTLNNTSVRVKNRTNLNQELARQGFDIRIGDRENAMYLSQIFLRFNLSSRAFIWRADYELYKKIVHLGDLAVRCGYTQPVRNANNQSIRLRITTVIPGDRADTEDNLFSPHQITRII